MSHFTTAVFSRSPADVEHLLAPYEEGVSHNMPRWDWYTIGGTRFEQIPLKDGGHTSQAPMSIIDFSPRAEERQRALKQWNSLYELGGDEAVQPYVDKYGTREHFADLQARFIPFAFVDADGQWHEEGTMGWFGLSSTTKESMEAYIAELDEYLQVAQAESLWLTLCDCHI